MTSRQTGRPGKVSNSHSIVPAAVPLWAAGAGNPGPMQLPAGGLFPGRAKPSQTLPPGRGVVRQAHHRWGNPVSPHPNRRRGRLAPPQAGGRFDRLTAGGETRFPHMFTSVIHAAAPHNAGMKIIILGRAKPSQTLPAGRGMGKPGFPMSQPLVGAAGAPTGRGAVRQAHRRWGNPVSPYVHLRPHARGAQRRDEHGVSLGGPPPPWPSPAGGGNRAPPLREGDGETRFPHVPTAGGGGWRPNGQGEGDPRVPRIFTSGPIRGAHTAAMTMGHLWEGRPLPGPPPPGGETGRLPAGRGVGKPGFPVGSPQPSMRLRRTTTR